MDNRGKAFPMALLPPPRRTAETPPSLPAEFKTFILRGNVVDLAVGVVVGAAFNSVISALVGDIITPLLSIPGAISFGTLDVRVGGGLFHVGHFLNAVLSFLLVAIVVFFVVVKPLNLLLARSKLEGHVALTRVCPFCKNTIPRTALRCGFCTSDLTETAAAPSAAVHTLAPRTPSDHRG